MVAELVFRPLAALAPIALLASGSGASAEESPGFENMDAVAYDNLFVDAVHDHQAGKLGDSFRKFLRLACGGDKASQEQIGGMYLAGEGVKKNVGMAYLWLKVASEFNFAPYHTIVSKIEAVLTPEQAKLLGRLADELRAQYGLRATNMSCHAQSASSFSSNIKDTVVCSPSRSGTVLQVQRCYADEVRSGAAAR